MSEKTKEELAHEREQMIKGMKLDDLSMLSDRQLALVQRVQMNRTNARARERIEKAMEGKAEDLGRALTTPPFAFTSPKISIMAGCVVKFSSLMTAQVRDVHTRLDEFIANENPNELRISDFLNRNLLAHSLVEFNDADFGGMMLDAGDYQTLRMTSPEQAQELLASVRNRRLQAIDDLSPHIVQRLIEFYQAFQFVIEAMTRGDEAEEALGN